MATCCKLLSYLRVVLSIVLAVIVSSPLQAFEISKIKLAGQLLKVEIAKTEAEHVQGLMHRKVLPFNEGMIFVFSDERPRSFWMKNTFVDLDILFFNSKQILVDKATLLGVKSEMQSQIPQYTSKKPAQYVVEVPAGWSSKFKLTLGSKFSFSK